MDTSWEGRVSRIILVHLTLDLITRIIVSRAYRLHSLRYESKIWRVGASLDGDMLHTILVTVILCTLTSDLVSRIIVCETYLLRFFYLFGA